VDSKALPPPIEVVITGEAARETAPGPGEVKEARGPSSQQASPRFASLLMQRRRSAQQSLWIPRMLAVAAVALVAAEEAGQLSAEHLNAAGCL
jgi:hypothetical protein